ncbi:glycoside hydrolase family 43 protein [Myceligenerans xiligouense]|uniref:Arabinan endo-1,5-alpha-L-arabinosidase n=1 Tax=Myceligenerans xiligouense TaxID=253184 RepID=A0A3N4YMK0_9MICO|nr:glycoside hydrolase family 43 protein [Myceligenerans xiligouense]RPF19670.1 arabinan endo-1,5-alpha-L-arabinosidase [Myceligenerans xiligouense]
MARPRLAGRTAAALAAGLLLLAPVAPASSATAEGSAATNAPTTPVAAPATGGITVTGDTSPIHDPALVVDERTGTWYVYSTGLVNRENGGTVQIWSSHDDGVTWAYEGTVWDEIPAWIDEHFSDGELPGSLWAPEVHEHDGTYYLYYSASRFGTNNSVTALATNTTLNPDDPDYEWVDQGAVITSPQEIENGKTFNAIDAGIVTGADGTPYMAIGSYWYGIFLVEISWPSGKPVDGALQDAVHLVDRFQPGNPVEAPYIYERDGWYYLFVSFDRCCAGGDSTYKVAVGRSRDVTGPYLDRDGRDMFGGGGTILLDAHGAIVGPGGQSVDDDVLAFHYYDASNEEIPYFPTLGLQRLDWVDGWPVVDTTVDAATLTTAPTDASARIGRKASFTATAAGTPRPLVLWEVSDDDGATWRAPEKGQPATSDDGTSTFSLRATPDTDGVLVRATATNPHGSETSAPVTLTAAKPGGGKS